MHKHVFEEKLVAKNYEIIDEEELLKFDDFSKLYEELSINLIYKEEFNKRLKWYYALILKFCFIHKYFDGGFSKNSMVNLIKGRTKAISSLKIGDRVENGGIIYGIVKIDKYGILSPSDSSESLEKIEDDGVLFHLLIRGDTSEFKVNGSIVQDYNNYIDSVIL